MPTATTMTVRQATLRWLEELGHLREATREGYSSVGRLLSRHFGADSPISTLNKARLEDFFKGERSRVKPSTYQFERRVLKLFTSWAHRQGILRVDGMSEVRSVRVVSSPPRILSRVEEALLIREAAVPLQGFIVLAVETGLRRRALLNMTWAMVNLDHGMLTLPGEIMKSGRMLRVPLSQRAWDTLVELRKGSTSELVFPFATSTLGDWWRAATKVVGLRGLKIHDLRKTFLTRCRQRGTPIEVAMKLSDHTDVTCALQVYRLVDDAELLRAVDRVPARDAHGVEVR